MYTKDKWTFPSHQPGRKSHCHPSAWSMTFACCWVSWEGSSAAGARELHKPPAARSSTTMWRKRHWSAAQKLTFKNNFQVFLIKKLQTSTKNKRRQEVNENTLRKTMETAKEVHYPVSGNCPGKQTGSEPGHTLKSQHYLLVKTSGGGGSFQHIFTDCNYLSQYKKTLGTFISKITAEHHLLSICLSTVFFIYAHTT